MKKIVLLTLIALSAATLGFADSGVFHGGDILYTKPVKAVLFSHAKHVEDLGMSCEMCHSGLFEMAALQAQTAEDFTMKSLYDGKYCGACHNGSFAFASDTQCARCHVGVKGYDAASGADGSAGKHSSH